MNEKSTTEWMKRVQENCDEWKEHNRIVMNEKSTTEWMKRVQENCDE